MSGPDIPVGTPVHAEIPRAQEQLFDARSSARDKYVRLVVGRPGLGHLVAYELVVTFTPLHLVGRGADRKAALADLMLNLEDATQDRPTALAFSTWCAEHLATSSDIRARRKPVG